MISQNQAHPILYLIVSFTGKIIQRRAKSTSSDSRISANHMTSIIAKLQSQRVRDSTAKNYLCIWRSFNKFVIRLDVKPSTWEERTSMFCAYLIQKGIKSSTISSYISAIKGVLKDDGYKWNEERVLLNSLVRACKLKNDVLYCCLPIQIGLLEILLFEIGRVFKQQFYLQILYQAMLCMGYYGLMRVGELTQGDHPVKACDVHMGKNKDKLMIILHSSKTHGISDYPQKIKIKAMENVNRQNLFCPFKAIRNYIRLRGDCNDRTENFFIFRDKSIVKPPHLRLVLKTCLKEVGLDASLYDVHSLRIGHACDLAKSGKYSVSEIKSLGRWSSSAVYKYLRQ